MSFSSGLGIIVSAPGRQPAGQTKKISNTFKVKSARKRVYLRHVYPYIETLEEVEVFHRWIDQRVNHSWLFVGEYLDHR